MNVCFHLIFWDVNYFWPSYQVMLVWNHPRPDLSIVCFRVCFRTDLVKVDDWDFWFSRIHSGDEMKLIDDQWLRHGCFRKVTFLPSWNVVNRNLSIVLKILSSFCMHKLVDENFDSIGWNKCNYLHGCELQLWSILDIHFMNTLQGALCKTLTTVVISSYFHHTQL